MFEKHTNEVAPTGISGLDEVLAGGFPKGRVFLIEGDPGSGKTTLALQFLMQGIKQGERSLYFSFAETKEEVVAVGHSHGWNLDKVSICEHIISTEELGSEDQYTFFLPSEVELGKKTQALLQEIERLSPDRVVFDSLSDLRLVAKDPLLYRRQVLGLKNYFIGKGCTVLLLDDRTAGNADLQLQSIAHGVISMNQETPEYGIERRRLRIVKMRGVKYRGGYHDFTIKRGGLEVFPRLVASEHFVDFAASNILSGVGQLDDLLGGGIPRGTSTLLIGPAGCGKSTVAIQYAAAAVERGEHASLFAFDEGLGTLFARSKGIGTDLTPYIEQKKLMVHQIDPAELTPGEFAQLVRNEVESRNSKVVVIDSLNGYLAAMPQERFLLLHLHELVAYLNQKGVITFMVVAQHGVLGASMTTPIDGSYLADSVILFRYFEVLGEVRRAISVMKKRSGPHEKTIRELKIGPEGIEVGPPLKKFQGILSGTPRPLES